jgi:hypothetical protein
MKVRFCALMLASFIASSPVLARDPDGRWANSPNKEWFNHLSSQRGLCCSSADGQAVQDPDWDTADGHYRVRLEGEWVVVPDEAVVSEPNRIGTTMVWPVYYNMGSRAQTILIRCFMPGSMT